MLLLRILCVFTCVCMVEVGSWWGSCCSYLDLSSDVRKTCLNFLYIKLIHQSLSHSSLFLHSTCYALQLACFFIWLFPWTSSVREYQLYLSCPPLYFPQCLKCVYMNKWEWTLLIEISNELIQIHVLSWQTTKLLDFWLDSRLDFCPESL